MENSDTIEDQILVAAFQVFVEKGFENAKMQDIAAVVGIKRTVLNYYFRSKELLYHKIAKTVISQTLPVILKTLNSDLPVNEKIEAFVSVYINTGLKNPFLPLFIVNELNSLGDKFIDIVFEGHSPNVEPFLAQLEAEMEKGKIIRMKPIQILIHIFSLCAFPLIARPMIKILTHCNNDEYLLLIEERKKEVVRFVLKGITP
ncbi:TetR/AcrR family transcriptional regulator [Flavobacterium sp.]|uniref:TetR/AcrR family transcriptional regulator n=1 Tax=Flavobacterium sp. TaxID=239 RepID=UPI00261D84F1|nr:TetR/AcrR family transcriptional regulator [Flavobacterium sp.]